MARVEVLSCHWSYEYALAGLESDIPCIVTVRDDPKRLWAIEPSWLTGVKVIMAKMVYERAKHITAVSEYIGRRLATCYGVNKKVSIIPNPVSDALWECKSVVKRGDVSSCVVCAMAVNGWTRLKNSKKCMEGFALLRRKCPAARMLAFGVGHENGGAAWRYATAQGIDEGIEFVGSIDGATLYGRLSREVDFVVHPSLEESFCNTIAESMALGVPVIGGCESGAVPETLNFGKAGLLVDVTSPEEIAAGMFSMIDVERRMSLALAAHEFAKERFRAGDIAQQYYSELRRIA